MTLKDTLEEQDTSTTDQFSGQKVRVTCKDSHDDPWYVGDILTYDYDADEIESGAIYVKEYDISTGYGERCYLSDNEFVWL